MMIHRLLDDVSESDTHLFLLLSRIGQFCTTEHIIMS